jgi:hypothetical protein
MNSPKSVVRLLLFIDPTKHCFPPDLPLETANMVCVSHPVLRRDELGKLNLPITAHRALLGLTYSLSTLQLD